jgi:transcriptional regulator with XRE-family HTH domain
MARLIRAYTALGTRINEVGKRQQIIADAMGISQQTVSKKLRGETAVLVRDLEKLADHFELPMSYWFDGDGLPPATTRAIRTLTDSKTHTAAALILADLSAADAERARAYMGRLQRKASNAA